MAIKGKFFYFLFGGFYLLLIIFILTITFFIKKEKKTLTSKAAQTDQGQDKVNLILKLSRNRSNGQIKIINAAANDGYSQSQNRSKYIEALNTHEIQQLVNNVIVSTLRFRFNEFIFSDKFLAPDEIPKSSDFVKKLDEPGIILSFPYIVGAKIQVKDVQTGQVQQLSATTITNATSAKKVVRGKAYYEQVVTDRYKGKPSNQTLGATANSNGVNFVFLSSNFSNLDDYASAVQSFANAIDSFPPFSDYANVYYSIPIANDDFGCYIDYENNGRIICDDANVYEAASSVPYDTIIVVHNAFSMVYGGTAWPGTYARLFSSAASLRPDVAVHEIGHIYYLNDEYDYGKESSPGGWPVYANCDTDSTCSKWSGTPGTGCFKVCGYTNWYRSTKNDCIMRLNGLFSSVPRSFDPVDEPVVRAAIQGMIDPSLTPTPTVKPTKTPTPKKTKTPTPTTVYTCKTKGNYCIPSGENCDPGDIYGSGGTCKKNWVCCKDNPSPTPTKKPTKTPTPTPCNARIYPCPE